jgi:hypothetical protein
MFAGWQRNYTEHQPLRGLAVFSSRLKALKHAENPVPMRLSREIK